MLTFKEYLLEATAPELLALKKYIADKLKVKMTSSSRSGIFHARFRMSKENMKKRTTFSKHHLKVEDYAQPSISGTFETYYIVATKDLPGIPAGTRIPWVNNEPGVVSDGSQLFGTKDLNPANLGLAGVTTDIKGIIRIVTNQLSVKYDEETTNKLVTLMRLSKTNQKVVKLPSSIDFDAKDLTKISADFGEVLAGIWSQTALGFKQVYYPVAPNEKLVDLYGIRLGSSFPISVKSGGGGKVNIQNILAAMKNRAKTQNINAQNEASIAIFNIVNDYSAKEQMIKLHQYMKTPAIKKLAEIMKTTPAEITLDSVNEFVNKKSNATLAKMLKPFWKILGQTLTDRVIEGPDKVRLIISPLGESIWKILNEDQKIKDSLNNLAKQVMLVQVNVDVTKRTINFESNSFKKASFEFGWAGYAAGNKLGFKMKLER